MNRIISIHEYTLKAGVSAAQFEKAVEQGRKRGLFNLPGLINYRFLKRIRGTRQTHYAAIWIYENKAAWSSLWGTVDNPIKKENYPEQWKIWENELLAPLLSQEPDKIFYASYEVF
jgi:hypothetical protein